MINIVFFGPIGLSIWAVQMIWIPLTAAGIINGLGHYCGYRNFQTEDASRNIFPLGLIIGGEELHNNHHAYASSARLSSKWYEFDVGWMYIRMLELCKLARVKKVAPQAKIDPEKIKCDIETLKSIIVNRYEVLTRFSNSVKKTYLEETKKMVFMEGKSKINWGQFKSWLHSNLEELEVSDKKNFEELLKMSPILKKVYTMRRELSEIWNPSSLTKEQLLVSLENWCQKAEQSGIIPLANFSRRLKGYG